MFNTYEKQIIKKYAKRLIDDKFIFEGAFFIKELSDYSKINLVAKALINNRILVKIDSLEEENFFRRLNDFSNYLKNYEKIVMDFIKLKNNFKKLHSDKKRSSLSCLVKKYFLDNKIYKLEKNVHEIVSEVYYEMRGQNYKDLKRKEKRRTRKLMILAFRKFISNKLEKDDNQK